MTITKEDLRQIADHVFGHHAAYNSHDGSMGFGRFLWELKGAVSESAMAFKRVAGQAEKLLRKEAEAPALSHSVREAGKDVQAGLEVLARVIAQMKVY
jgi:hypothetical protein